MDDASRLWAVEQIKQLKARYFRFLDTKQWKDYRQVFTNDAKLWMGDIGRSPEPSPPHETPDAFVGRLAAAHDEARVVSVHHGHMPEIEILDECHARGIWAMFDWVDRPHQWAFQGFGHYYEEYEKGMDDMWRIKSMRLTRLRTDQMPSTAEVPERYGWVPPWWA